MSIHPKAPLRPLPEKERLILRKLIGRRVRAARGELGLSGRALAKVFDHSESWVREVEKGDQFAPWWLIVALAEATGRPVGWFSAFWGGSGQAPGLRVERAILGTVIVFFEFVHTVHAMMMNI